VCTLQKWHGLLWWASATFEVAFSAIFVPFS
jgi:hypothetical protein